MTRGSYNEVDYSETFQSYEDDDIDTCVDYEEVDDVPVRRPPRRSSSNVDGQRSRRGSAMMKRMPPSRSKSFGETEVISRDSLRGSRRGRRSVMDRRRASEAQEQRDTSASRSVSRRNSRRQSVEDMTDEQWKIIQDALQQIS